MYSHPEVELKEHLENVYDIGMRIFEDFGIEWGNKEKIFKVLEIILKTHDFGKATPYFQEYIREPDNEKFKKSPGRELKSHALFSAIWTYYLIMKEVKDEKLALIGFMVVKRHHGALDNFEAEKFIVNQLDIEKERLEIWNRDFNYEYFCKEDERKGFIGFQDQLSNKKLKRSFRKLKKEFSREDYLLCNLLFSILITADKGEAIFHSKSEVENLKEIKGLKRSLERDLVDRYKVEKFGKGSDIGINGLREEAYREVENSIMDIDLDKKRVLSINLPTGLGKTLAAINASLKLRERIGKESQIIYNLPFTSIIDQNYDVFKKVLGNQGEDAGVLLKHHYLTEKEYNGMDYDISKYLIEGWESEIVVTTFVQLINSIFTNKNRQLIKFNKFANSIIILDEVQSIPYKYWKAVRETLDLMCEKLNCYVILVTATMPLLFSEEKEEIYELARSKEKYFDALNRIKMDVSLLKRGGLTNQEFYEIAKEDIENNKDKSFLFVFNTIKSSLKFYEGVKDEFDNKTIIYLSSNITPLERMKRIEYIKENKDVIVVSTQMVEAGVDIDLDVVYRDFGPLDSINQVAGRCNRNGLSDELGRVMIYKLLDEENRNKEYYSYIYKEKILKHCTMDALNEYGDVIEEREFYNLSKTYFKYIDKAKSNDKSDEILKAIDSLIYEDIGIDLIDKKFQTVDLFIQLTDESKEIWADYERALDIENRYEREEKYNKIKSQLYSYVISVPEKLFYGDGERVLNLVDETMIDQYYSFGREKGLELIEGTGFKREPSFEDFCM